MAIRPLFGQIPYRQPQSLLDVITQQAAQSEALRGRAAERALREAQVRKLTQEMEHPELSLAGLPAIARQRAYVASVKKAFGPDSPQAIAAQKDLDLTQHNMESQLQYRQALAKTLPVRALTTPGKVILEQQRVKGGYLPTGEPVGQVAPTPVASITPQIKPKVAGTPQGTPSLENKLSKMSKDDLIKAKEAPFGTEEGALYSLYASKLAGLGDNTKKLTYASTLQQTLNLMTPFEASMAYYSGVAGKERYGEDLAKAQLTGEITPQLQDYTKFKEMANGALVEQLTQYYGTSVTEGQQKILRKAADPATWNKSPELALTAYDALKKVLETEIKGRQDLVEHPSFLIKKQKKETPLDERVKKTGMSLNELVKIANQNNISVVTLIENINRLKGGS